MAGAVFVVVVVDATDQQMAHDTQRGAVDAGALGQDSFRRRRRRLCRPVARLFLTPRTVSMYASTTVGTHAAKPQYREMKHFSSSDTVKRKAYRR